MAFMSMVLVFLFFVIIVMCSMFFSGLRMIVRGLAKKKNDINGQERSSKRLITIGSILMGIPTLIVILPVISSTVSEITGEIRRKRYDNILDKWKNEDISIYDSGEESDEALKEMLKAIDNRDKDAIISLYPEYIQNDPELEKQVDVFLNKYKGGFSELEYKNASDSWSSVIDEIYAVYKDDKRYYISIGICFKSNDKSRVGIRYFCINSEEEEMKDHDSYVLYQEKNDDFYIQVNYGSPNDP